MEYGTYYGKEVLVAIKKLPLNYTELIKEAGAIIAEQQYRDSLSLSDTFHFRSYDLTFEIQKLDDYEIFEIMRKSKEESSFRECKQKYVRVFMYVDYNEPNRRLVKEIERTVEKEIERVYI